MNSITERIDNITLITDDYLKERPPAPKSVKIELSPRCNFRCSFCALRTRDEQPKVDMDIELFKRITTEMVEAGVEEIGLFYLGESMMNPPLLVEAIKWCKQVLGVPYVFLTSNASLATPDVVGAIMTAGLDSLKWSVNAADEEQFEQIMGISPKYFDIALQNIRGAYKVRHRLKASTGLYASSIMYNGKQQERMETLIRHRVAPYVDEHYWLPLYQMGMHSERVEKAIGAPPTHGNMGRVGALRKPIPCWSAFMEGHVRADGGLSVCCFGSDARFDAGDLTEQTFMEAWNSEKFQEVRRAHIKADAEGTGALKGTMCEVCVAFGE